MRRRPADPYRAHTGLHPPQRPWPHPRARRADVRVFARLAIEAAYATQEMLFDDPGLDAVAVGRMLASMISGEAIKLRRPNESR